MGEVVIVGGASAKMLKGNQASVAVLHSKRFQISTLVNKSDVTKAQIKTEVMVMNLKIRVQHV